MQDAAPFQILRPRQQRNQTILPRKQRVCSVCGDPISVFIHGGRHPHSRQIMRGHQGVTMKDHDVCGACWKRYLAQADTRMRTIITAHIGSA